MSDVLSAASLLLAVLTALFGLWLPDISVAAGLKLDMKLEDRRPNRNVIRRCLWGKAAPLALATLLIAAIFANRALGIIVDTIASGFSGSFQDLSAAFVVTELLMIALAFVSTFQALRLHSLLRTSAR
jgi:hypothetical protein